MFSRGQDMGGGARRGAGGDWPNLNQGDAAADTVSENSGFTAVMGAWALELGSPGLRSWL